MRACLITSNQKHCFHLMPVLSLDHKSLSSRTARAKTSAVSEEIPFQHNFLSWSFTSPALAGIHLSLITHPNNLLAFFLFTLMFFFLYRTLLFLSIMPLPNPFSVLCSFHFDLQRCQNSSSQNTVNIACSNMIPPLMFALPPKIAKASKMNSEVLKMPVRGSRSLACK